MEASVLPGQSGLAGSAGLAGIKVVPLPVTVAAPLSHALTIDPSVQPFAMHVLAQVTSVEATDPTLPSETKLQIVVKYILALAQVAQGIPIPPVPAIAALVSMTVGILNANGFFTHHKKPVPAA